MLVCFFLFSFCFRVPGVVAKFDGFDFAARVLILCYAPVRKSFVGMFGWVNWCVSWFTQSTKAGLESMRTVCQGHRRAGVLLLRL